MKFITSLTFLLFLFAAGYSQKPKDLAKATERATGALKVFQQFAALGSESMPMSLYRDARAIAVFADTTKVTILLSQLTVGRGLASVRLEDGWSVPAYVTLKGSDMNLKIAGKKSFDIVVLIMDEKVVESLRKGVIASAGGKGKGIAQGPVVNGPGSEDVIKKALALYYVFENGQLVDYDLANNALLGQFNITLDNDLNKLIFGVKAKELFGVSKRDSLHIPIIDKFRETLLDTLPKSNLLSTPAEGVSDHE